MMAGQSASISWPFRVDSLPDVPGMGADALDLLVPDGDPFAAQLAAERPGPKVGFKDALS